MNEIQSKYFQFEELKNETKPETKFYHYLGWNSLIILKLEIKKNAKIDFKKINQNYSKISNKQKIFVLTEGECNFEIEKTIHNLKKFDAVDLVAGNEQYELKAIEDSLIYIVSAFNLEKQDGKPKIFNFEKNIESKNLWGGQIISRPYEGNGLTFVLFDLKKGFKFEDKGHANEQITWLISGEMDFYTNNIHKKLYINNGVDIGPYHLHGGVSGGAKGFDVFFPKRQEVKYKN